MSHKLGICIPYRNRKEHVEQLIPHLTKYLNEKGIEHKFYIGHQVDDKLFNRGAMKNIAAHYAFEDGCDYIAWHDVDMLALEKDELICDYSYPEETPIHIATKLSKYHYGLGYDQYFGGVVLFNKEQAYKTNGYSNDYWDWGQEDDDLFWRCYFEEYTTGKVLKNYGDRKVLYFNGENSVLKLPTNREISTSLHNEFTISMLFSAEQQPEKVPIWLVGDKEKKFIEYPLIRKEGSWTWGLSFNNSRAITMVMFDKNSNHHYNWGKRFENLWTWVTLSYSKENRGAYLYINNELICQMNGIKEEKPFPITEDLKSHDSIRPFLIGFCEHMNTHFKGKIAEIKMFNKFIDDINEAIDGENDLTLHYNFNDSLTDLVNDGECEKENVELITDKVELVENVLPFRREGNFYCMSHEDEGFVNGTWKKGETTAKNERRFVTEMQQKKINYKEDGLKNILSVLDVDNIDQETYPNTMFINVKMK
jgi:hypothetical protein